MKTQARIHRPVSTPLSEHSVLRTGSVGEACTFLKRKNIDLQPVPSRSSFEGFNAAIDAAYLQRMYVAYMEYGIAVEMRPLAPFEADYGVHLPLGGWIDLSTGNQSVQCGAGSAAVVSPANRLSLKASAECRRLLLSVRQAALTQHLATLLGDLPTERVVFDPTADPALSDSRRLAEALWYAAREFERSRSLDGNDIVITQFEQYLMTLLLMAQPNNYSEALHTRDKGVRPRDVKRAIDYIDANLEQVIKLEDLVAASGVPGRTLYQHFQSFVGTSPMGYIKRARYHRVREALARSRGEATVTQVAGRWGFTHMGRFSAEYRRRFGELPSITARRRQGSKR